MGFHCPRAAERFVRLEKEGDNLGRGNGRGQSEYLLHHGISNKFGAASYNDDTEEEGNIYGPIQSSRTISQDSLRYAIESDGAIEYTAGKSATSSTGKSWICGSEFLDVYQGTGTNAGWKVDSSFDC